MKPTSVYVPAKDMDKNDVSQPFTLTIGAPQQKSLENRD